MSGQIGVDPLFLGLTRPPMVFGVTYNYVAINMMITMCYFIMRSDLKVIFLTAIVHGISYLICLKEPYLIEMFMMRQGKFRSCKNRAFYRFRNSYDPF